MKSPLNIKMAVATVCAFALPPALSQESSGEHLGGESLTVGFGFADSAGPTHGRFGLGVGALPGYEGSDEYSATMVPLVDVAKSGTFFLKGGSINVNDGLASAGITLFHITYSDGPNQNSQLLIGPLIRVYPGRDEDTDKMLRGLGSLDAGAGFGGFMTLTSGPLAFSLAAASQDTGEKNPGLLITLDAAYTTLLGDDLILSSGLSASWADDNYMRGYFGVNGKQAAKTGLTQFDGSSGFKDVGINFRATYRLSRQWAIDGQVGYWRLLNDAASSPLVEKEGSANQLRGLIGISYHF